MPFRTDETMPELMASADEMVSRDEREAERYDDEMTDADYEAEKAAFAAKLPSVADIRAKLRAAWGTEGEVFGRSLESRPAGVVALDRSHEGNQEGAA